MPAQLQTRASTGLVVDQRTHTIRLTRIFDAPPADIFDAWTQPEQVTCWWDAAGEPLSICEIDLRPGGAFRFVSKGHLDMPFAGTYREISPPDRLVFDAMGAIGRVTFQSLADKTRMVVEIACNSPEQLEQFVSVGVDVGTSQTLDNLVIHMQRRGRQ
jgi:uncharacterized protein YndB with AHSA1/START domain